MQLQKSENLSAPPKKTVPTDLDPVEKISQCAFHEGKELELYCETCGELICWKCIAKGGKHHDHDYEELEAAFEKYKVEITSLLEPLEKQVTTTKTALAQLDARCGEISDQRAATAINVHTNFRRLREALDVRENDIIGQLDRVAQRKLKGLATQRDQIETTLAQQCSCLFFMRESLRPGSKGDVLMMKTNTVKQGKELTTPLQREFLEPNTEADIEFVTSTGECQNYGQIVELDLPDPSKCKLVSNFETATAGEKCLSVLHVVNFRGELYEEGIEALECSLVSEISGTRASCSVERRGQGQYEISYQPTIKGRHQLHIKAQGQHIRGSPFSIAVKSPLEKLGTPILTIPVVEPWRVAINHRGEVVVTKWKDHCVSVFNPSGERLRSFGTRDFGFTQVQCPRGVAVDGVGNILFTDKTNNRHIQKFTIEGTSVGSGDRRPTGITFNGNRRVSQPTGITFNATNSKVYVIDTGSDCVKVLNSDLTFSSSFGGRGSGRGQFNHPCDIACNSTGKVYVADHRIQVFTAEGEFLRVFGGQGLELDYPVGLAIDTNDDMVYVSEGDKHRVSVFTSEGRFVTSFGRKGKGPGEFMHPRGLAVNCGVVYVCDRDNNRVQGF
jgi:DNA-binding beta-propeller fold protein YncE